MCSGETESFGKGGKNGGNFSAAIGKLERVGGMQIEVVKGNG